MRKLGLGLDEEPPDLEKMLSRGFPRRGDIARIALALLDSIVDMEEVLMFLGSVGIVGILRRGSMRIFRGPKLSRFGLHIFGDQLGGCPSRAPTPSRRWLMLNRRLPHFAAAA